MIYSDIMKQETFAGIKEFALSLILDPVTWMGNPELCSKVARWADFSEKGRLHFIATAHISRAAYARTYFGDEYEASRQIRLANSLIDAANFIQPKNTKTEQS